MSFIYGLTPSQIRELKLKDLYKVIQFGCEISKTANPKKQDFLLKMTGLQKLGMLLENKVLQN